MYPSLRWLFVPACSYFWGTEGIRPALTLPSNVADSKTEVLGYSQKRWCDAHNGRTGSVCNRESLQTQICLKRIPLNGTQRSLACWWLDGFSRTVVAKMWKVQQWSWDHCSKLHAVGSWVWRCTDWSTKKLTDGNNSLFLEIRPRRWICRSQMQHVWHFNIQPTHWLVVLLSETKLCGLYYSFLQSLWQFS